MTDGKMATQASQLIGFKQALSAFSQAMGKFGDSSGQICFVLYPDGTIGPKLNGEINPSHCLAAARFLMQVADEQFAAMNAEMRDLKLRAGGPSMPLPPPHVLKGN